VQPTFKLANAENKLKEAAKSLRREVAKPIYVVSRDAIIVTSVMIMLNLQVTQAAQGCGHPHRGFRDMGDGAAVPSAV
jgi:hypothetical protein